MKHQSGMIRKEISLKRGDLYGYKVTHRLNYLEFFVVLDKVGRHINMKGDEDLGG